MFLSENIVFFVTSIAKLKWVGKWKVCVWKSSLAKLLWDALNRHKRPKHLPPLISVSWFCYCCLKGSWKEKKSQELSIYDGVLAWPKKHVHFSVEFTYVNSSCRLVQSTSILVIFILRRSDWARRISESSTTDNQSVGFVTAVWKGNIKRRKFTVVHKWREFWRVFDHILFRFAYSYINLSCISDRSRETLSHLPSNLRKQSVAGKFFKMCLTSGRAFTFFVEGNALPKPFDWKLN